MSEGVSACVRAVHMVCEMMIEPHPLVRREPLDGGFRPSSFPVAHIRYLDGRGNAALGIKSLFPSICFCRFGGVEGEGFSRFEEMSAWRQGGPR